MVGEHGTKEARATADNIHDAEDAKRYRVRLRKQQRYSQNYRDKLKAEQAPDTDDVARACRRTLVRLLATEPASVRAMSNAVLADLIGAGFARDPSIQTIRLMVRRERAKQPRRIGA